MKTAFYPKLAAEGIKKNRKLYLPYILTCILMVSMFYIISFMKTSSFIQTMRGGSSAVAILALGTYVIGIFAVIFLFYTNSFLIRRRKKEFGLYNILGMDKHSIGKILAWETLTVSVISIILGLCIGILFSKLAELLLANMIGDEISLAFTVSLESIEMTLIVFAVIFLLLFLNGIRQLRFSNPIELLRSENHGEKAPKANWVLGILGIAILGVAYYLSVSISNPLEAFVLFFVAVIMVIIATYMIFISGSVLLCKLLQKNKDYYYKKNHFISVSYMVYRMKRNGAGLASICILLTMVFVMISSTTCLYFGKEDSLRRMYPSDIMIEVQYDNGLDSLTDENVSKVLGAIDGVLATYNATDAVVTGYRCSQITGLLKGNYIDVYAEDETSLSFTDITNVYIIPIEDYNDVMGASVTLNAGEALLYTVNTSKLPDTLNISDALTVKIVDTVDEFKASASSAVLVVPYIYLFVPNYIDTLHDLSLLRDRTYNSKMLSSSQLIGINPNVEEGLDNDIASDIHSAVFGLSDSADVMGVTSSSIEGQRGDFFGTYCGFFYLGICLSIVFLVAAVLIIYYKQISEGFEDRARYEIMQKVGLTKPDIKKSINSQMLTVFFMPIVFAVLHLAFAFPMIKDLLILLQLTNISLLYITTVISIVVFVLFYVIVYKITSNSYYSIVSNAEKD